MIELGKSGAAGVGKGAVPVLVDGQVVAVLRASSWKEAATAQIGDREWTFVKRGRRLTGRWSVEPAEAARLEAQQTSFWKGTWSARLDGVPVEITSASVWKGTHRYTSGGRPMGESGTTGGWSPRPTLTVDPSMPLEHQVFLLWIELVISRRNAAAAGGAVAGGVVATS